MRWLALASVALACALLALAPRGGRFDVAAAVYRAIARGHGVRYVVTDQESEIHGKRTLIHAQRWSTNDPPSERTLTLERRNYGRERTVLVESAIAPGSTWSSWWSGRPGVIEHTKATGILRDEVAIIRAAYRAGRLRLLEKTRLDGRAVYRLQVIPPRSGPGNHYRATPTDLLVDASTFVPIEVIDYARGSHGRLLPTFVMRYETFVELPATPSNLAMLKLAAHPGARVVERG